MGRALLLAAEFPFRAVVGVELNPTLARIGRTNMALWRKAGRARAPMRMICRDAAEFELPPGPCVVFLFNPFGAPVLAAPPHRMEPEPCRTRAPTRHSLRQQRAGAGLATAGRLRQAVCRRGQAVASRCNCRPQDPGQPARRRVRRHQLGRLLDPPLVGKPGSLTWEGESVHRRRTAPSTARTTPEKTFSRCHTLAHPIKMARL